MKNQPLNAGFALNPFVQKPLLNVSLCFLFCLGSLAGQTQESFTLSGQVFDQKSGSTLPGVAVYMPSGKRGVTTDLEGAFSIRTSIGAQIEFAFVGYKKQVHRVTDRQPIKIYLSEETSLLDEVMVVGYGSSTRKELTGATSDVKGEELEKLNLPRLDQALQGQMAGVNITSNSGSPGGQSIIRIRGLSTFGDNDPLILVDGIVYDSEGLNTLNPSDIESVNVLKDGTAAIYGVRAANGVILITTKKGSKNSAPQFEFTTYYGIQETTRRLDLLNATEYAVIKNNAFINGGDPAPFANTALGEGTDWQDAVFQTAPIENYSLSMNGGTDRSSYSIGGTYFRQKGIVGGDKAQFERWNGRVNYTNEISERLRFNSVLLYTFEERAALPENGIGSVLYNTINAYPTEPLREDGRYSYLNLVNDLIHPLAQMENTHNRSAVNKFVGKEELAYDLAPGLTWTNRFNFNVALVDYKAFNPLTWYGPGKPQNTAANDELEAPRIEIADSVFIDRGANVEESRSTYSDLTFESYLNYEKTFQEDHKVKASLGVSAFSRRGEGLTGVAFNIPYNSLDFADISANQAENGYLNNTYSFQFRERLLSAFTRAEYAYKDRYLFSTILRRDGSSKFGANNRWGFFPVFSGAWIISEEDFAKVEGLDFAKLRLSFGTSGNDQIPNFAYRALLNGEGVYVWDDIIRTGVAIGRAANDDLKWESTSQWNLGLDIGFLKNFSATFNYFIKETSDLLFQPDVSGVLGTYGPGGYPPFVNAGDVRNSGVELELGYRTPVGSEWSFSAQINGSYIRNEVTSTPNGVDFIPGAAFGVGGNIATRFQESFPIGYFIGLETDGIFQTQAEIDNAAVVQAGAQPGDLRFVDQNGDGVINFSDDSDRVQLGTPIPDFTFGLSLNTAYKGFDLSCHVYAAIGQEIIRNYERQQPYANQLDYVIGRWVGNGSSNEIPRVTTDLTRNNVFSDHFVEDGSFLRIRNLQLGYSLPKSWVNPWGAERLRIYVAANNLWTLTAYQGFDPDIGNFGGPLAAGVDYGFYPQPRTFMGGLQMNF